MAYKGALMVDDEQFLAVLEQTGQDRRPGDGPLRERRRRRALPEGGAWRRATPTRKFHAWSRPPEVEGEATGRAIRLAEWTKRPLFVVHVTCEEAVQRDPGGARPRPADLRRDLHPVPLPDRRRPRPAGLRGRQVRLLAAAARGAQPGGALPGAAPGRAAGHLHRPLPVQLQGAEGARARATSRRSRTACRRSSTGSRCSTTARCAPGT